MHDHLALSSRPASNDDAKRLCATCAHRAGFTPTTCGLMRDDAGNARLTQPLRAETGSCGPEGAFWERAEATGGSVLEFPKAGRFA